MWNTVVTNDDAICRVFSFSFFLILVRCCKWKWDLKKWGFCLYWHRCWSFHESREVRSSFSLFTSVLASHRNVRVRTLQRLMENVPHSVPVALAWMQLCAGKVILEKVISVLSYLTSLCKTCVLCVLRNGWRSECTYPRVAFDKKKNVNIFMRSICWECRAGFAFPWKHLRADFQAVVNFHSIKIEPSLN